MPSVACVLLKGVLTWYTCLNRGESQLSCRPHTPSLLMLLWRPFICRFQTGEDRKTVELFPNIPASTTSFLWQTNIPQGMRCLLLHCICVYGLRLIPRYRHDMGLLAQRFFRPVH